MLSSRIFALALVFTGMFLVLAAKLFDLQIINGESYLEDYVQMIRKNSHNAWYPQANIYDRNGKLLAYNELAYAADGAGHRRLSQKRRYEWHAS